MLTKPYIRIGILTLVHLVVDFYLGITTPLVEPTLVNHLGVNLFYVMIIISGTSICVNAIQPLSGCFMPKKGIPIILLLAPIFAGTTTLIGLTNNYYIVFALMLQAAFWIGIMHPEAVLTVQSLSKNSTFATSVFISGGFFGFSFGSFVGAKWAQDIGIGSMWILIIPGFVVSFLIYLSKLHKYKANHSENIEGDTSGEMPFLLVFVLAVFIAITFSLFSRFIPVYIVRSFGDEAQIWGGTTLFAIGLTGALSSYLWSYLSKRTGKGLIIIAAYTLGLPFIYFLRSINLPSYIPYWGIGTGFFLAGIFPLTVAMSRNSKGGTPRMRAGLCIGGAWGIGALVVIACSKYIDMFPAKSTIPLNHILNLCFITIPIVIILAAVIAKKEDGMRK